MTFRDGLFGLGILGENRARSEPGSWTILLLAVFSTRKEFAKAANPKQCVSPKTMRFTKDTA